MPCASLVVAGEAVEEYPLADVRCSGLYSSSSGECSADAVIRVDMMISSSGGCTNSNLAGVLVVHHNGVDRVLSMGAVYKILRQGIVAPKHVLSWTEAVHLAEGILGVRDGCNCRRHVSLVHALLLADALEHIFPEGPLSLRISCLPVGLARSTADLEPHPVEACQGLLKARLQINGDGARDPEYMQPAITQSVAVSFLARETTTW